MFGMPFLRQCSCDALSLFLVPIEAFMPGLDQSLVDHSTEEWLDYLESKLNYKAWFCGHWHMDKRIDLLIY